MNAFINDRRRNSSRGSALLNRVARGVAQAVSSSSLRSFCSWSRRGASPPRRSGMECRTATPMIDISAREICLARRTPGSRQPSEDEGVLFTPTPPHPFESLPSSTLPLGKMRPTNQTESAATRAPKLSKRRANVWCVEIMRVGEKTKANGRGGM